MSNDKHYVVYRPWPFEWDHVEVEQWTPLPDDDIEKIIRKAMVKNANDRLLGLGFGALEIVAVMRGRQLAQKLAEALREYEGMVQNVPSWAIREGRARFAVLPAANLKPAQVAAFDVKLADLRESARRGILSGPVWHFRNALKLAAEIAPAERLQPTDHQGQASTARGESPSANQSGGGEQQAGTSQEGKARTASPPPVDTSVPPDLQGESVDRQASADGPQPVGELDDTVTLDQAAAISQRSKRTLERDLSQEKLPGPDIPGGQGAAAPAGMATQDHPGYTIKEFADRVGRSEQTIRDAADTAGVKRPKAGKHHQKFTTHDISRIARVRRDGGADEDEKGKWNELIGEWGDNLSLKLKAKLK